MISDFKKFINHITYVFALTILFTCLFINTCSANNDIKVFAANKILNTSAIEQNGYAYLPVRDFFESLGFSVEWNENQNSVTAYNENSSVYVVLRNNTLTLNGNTLNLDNAIIEINGVTYAPLRTIAQAMGYEVDWYDSSQTAVIKNSNQKYDFYGNTPALMPTFESVVPNASFAQSNWIAQDVGIYYMYKGATEQDAVNYANILTENFSFKYDSMQLSENYSKLYVYVNEKTTAIVEVSKDEVYIYPSVSSRYAYEPLKEDVSSQMTRDDVKNDALLDNKQTQKPNIPNDVVYYDGTTIPDYSYITGKNLYKQTETENGYIVNIYFSNIFDVMNYMSELNLTYGFSNYTMNTSPFDMTVTYKSENQNEYVAAIYSMMSDCVYISYGTK